MVEWWTKRNSALTPTSTSWERVATLLVMPSATGLFWLKFRAILGFSPIGFSVAGLSDPCDSSSFLYKHIQQNAKYSLRKKKWRWWEDSYYTATQLFWHILPSTWWTSEWRGNFSRTFMKQLLGATKRDTFFFRSSIEAIARDWSTFDRKKSRSFLAADISAASLCSLTAFL